MEESVHNYLHLKKRRFPKETIKLFTIFLFAVIALLVGIIKYYSYFYFIFSVFTATLIISFLVHVLSGKSLFCERIILVDRVYQDQKLKVEIFVENRGLLPQIFLTIEDIFDKENLKARPSMFFIPVIWPKAKKKFTYELYCLKRGFYDIGPIKISYFDPFGLFPRRKYFLKVNKILVYPKFFEIDFFPLVAGRISTRIGLEVVPRSGGAIEFYNLREFRQGDSPRLIHWKSFARSGRLVVKEFEKNVTADVTLFLDLYKDQEIGFIRSKTNIEYAISVAATLIRYFIRRYNSVQLITSSKYLDIIIEYGLGEAHFFDILSKLAIIRADSEKNFSDLIIGAYNFLSDRSVVFLVLPKVSKISEILRIFPSLRSKNIKTVVVAIDENSFKISELEKSLQAKIPEEVFKIVSAGAVCSLIRYGDNISEKLVEIYQ